MTGFSGADLAALVREACVAALKEQLAATGQGADAAGGAPPPAGFVSPRVRPCHFRAAAQRVQPSVSPEEQKIYEALRRQQCSSRRNLAPAGERATGQESGRGGPAGDDDMEGSAGVPEEGGEPMEAEAA